MKKNMLINNGLDAMKLAVKKLSSLDITIIGFYHDFISRPTIEIEHHPYCHQLINEGLAVYYKKEGYYRFGQFKIGLCRIIWKELDTYRLTLGKMAI